ncbi:hypothetical protein CCR75_008725 [Bremia lactucae]|uniref:NPP1-like protein n=1 Tax=Bremia lactucae TaxID=4779 RepID=A0A976IF74_BRELC|nr:hypothetical protein CCR75_008725 [Bremia lactucae]
MRNYLFKAIALGSLAFVSAQEINIDEIEPLPGLEPNSTMNKIILQFQPQLHVSSGCQPYPAVDSTGHTSSGLGLWKMGTKCNGSPLGSQVYARTDKFNGYTAIMYAWYFPRDYVVRPTGHRHGWEHAIVWLGGYGHDPKLLSVSVKSMIGYRQYSPPDKKFMDGSSIKLKYTWVGLSHHYLTATKKKGERQELALWDDLTDTVKGALQDKDSFGFYTPISDHDLKKREADEQSFRLKKLSQSKDVDKFEDLMNSIAIALKTEVANVCCKINQDGLSCK